MLGVVSLLQFLLAVLFDIGQQRLSCLPEDEQSGREWQIGLGRLCLACRPKVPLALRFCLLFPAADFPASGFAGSG